MNYPNMATEVIEAIHLMYEDYPDVEADCYLYLKSLYLSENTLSLATKAVNALTDMNRCPTCGTLLMTDTVKERHPEVEGISTELVFFTYCPNCNKVERTE